jgi:hypothetical protein
MLECYAQHLQPYRDLFLYVPFEELEQANPEQAEEHRNKQIRPNNFRR